MVRILARVQAILTEGFCFSSVTLRKYWDVLIGHHRFLPYHSQFIFHLIILLYKF
jgi:hypothetical protein